MAATARIVESVGVSAYLGGAALVSDPILLTSAASILTVEARHQTILNILSSVGTAIPNAFDFALTPSEILALASPFFNGTCDVGVPGMLDVDRFPIKLIYHFIVILANPILSVTNTGSIGPGTQLNFSSPAINGSTNTNVSHALLDYTNAKKLIIFHQGFFCQMLLGGQPTSIPFPFNNCVVPSGINGPVAIFITSDGQPLINNVVDRATTQLVAGPLLTFLDTQPQVLGEAVGITSGSSSNSSSSSGSGSTITTQTISSAQASAIISSAVSAAASTSALPPSPYA